MSSGLHTTATVGTLRRQTEQTREYCEAGTEVLDMGKEQVGGGMEG